MSELGSLYINLGSPDGELGGCCETADWAAKEIERLRKAAKEAAHLLRDEAENLKWAHTINGVWDISCDGEVIAHYKRVMELVERLDSSNALSSADAKRSAATKG